MTDTTIHSSEIPLPALKVDLFRVLLGFFVNGVRDMNRYMDAAGLVHPGGLEGSNKVREQS